jgi:hypothetical protein
MSSYERRKKRWTFIKHYATVFLQGGIMSAYEEGFADGMRKAKDDLLEWADTFEGDPNEDGYVLFYEKIIELLEQ